MGESPREAAGELVLSEVIDQGVVDSDDDGGQGDAPRAAAGYVTADGGDNQDAVGGDAECGEE